MADARRSGGVGDRTVNAVKSSPSVLERLYGGIEDNRILTSVRRGMVLAIPEILVGSFSLLLLSLPVGGWQALLDGLWSGSLRLLLTVVRDATLGVISLIMLLTISYSYEEETPAGHRGTLPFVSLCAYLAFTYGPEGFAFAAFESSRLFGAIVVTIASCALFTLLSERFSIRMRSYTDGSDSAFQRSISAIVPACLVIGLFALLGVLLTRVLGGADYSVAFSGWFEGLFLRMGRGLGSGLLIILLMHLMWFFGIHGSNVLDGVAHEVFRAGMDVNLARLASGQAPTEIATKTFFDTFVLFGGCGTLLCLVVAIFLCDRRKNVRGLSKMALVPVLFNINELIMFGVPIVLNPIYLVPFLCTPLVLTVISYLATLAGLVPVAIHTVEWTTPIFLSGYAATGSVAGSLLQLVNLAVGVGIYLPFVRLAQARQLRSLEKQMERLAGEVRACEAAGERPALLARGGQLGSMAKLLAEDLRYALRSGGVRLHYQPQTDARGRVWGAEALLRWEHGPGRFVYPPLAVALAAEGGFADELAAFVVDTACRDLAALSEWSCRELEISCNLTAGQLTAPGAPELVKKAIERYHIPPGRLGVELTEQDALSGAPQMTERLAALRETGARIIMDDFGMGHNSMLYLQDSQFDMVKLDGSLVREMTDNPRTGEIISTIVRLSESLGFRVVAEYVETPAQLEALGALGCRYYQGYLFSPAIPLSELKKYIREH